MKHILLMLGALMLFPMVAITARAIAGDPGEVLVVGNQRGFGVLCSVIVYRRHAELGRVYVEIAPLPGDSTKAVFTKRTITDLRDNPCRAFYAGPLTKLTDSDWTIDTSRPVPVT